VDGSFVGNVLVAPGVDDVDDDEVEVILLMRLEMGRDFVLFEATAVVLALVVDVLVAETLGDEIIFPFLSFDFIVAAADDVVVVAAASCTIFPLASSCSFIVSTFSEIPVTERDLFFTFFC
jgi:hypothetical protein